jgi:hypothetical protein
MEDGWQDAVVRGVCDADRFPALAFNAQPMRGYCHQIANELDEVAGPVTVGNGKRLDGESLLQALLAMGFILRRMTADESDGYATVHQEVLGE